MADSEGVSEGASEAPPQEAVKAENAKVETQAAPAPEAKTEEVKVEAKNEIPAPAAPAPEAKAEAVPEKAESAEVKTVTAEVKPAAAITLTGVVVKWKFAKTPETALAFLDSPEGKNQAFVTGSTPELQEQLTKSADSGKPMMIKGNYIAGKMPPVFSVVSIDLNKQN